MASASADLQKAWRASLRSPSFYAQTAGNLLPLIGLVFLHWRVELLILFYLLECVVAYFVTAKMIAFVARDREQSELMLVHRFLLGAGVCMIAAGVFWAYVMGWFAGLRGDTSWVLTFVLSAAAMAAGHVYAYFHDFIGRKEHERIPTQAIQDRWGRIFFGTVVAMLVFPALVLFSSLTPFAVVLVMMKALADLSAFVAERARAAGSKATSIAYTRPTARCPRCNQLLRTDTAKQCFHCGADWHQSAA